MEINNNKKDTQRELCSYSDIPLSSFSSEDQNELNPLQETFSAHLSSSTPVSSEPKDAVIKNSDQRETWDHCNKCNHTNKRHHSMMYLVMMENKRRQLIRDRIDILQGMTPYCTKSDLVAKLEDIIEYIKSLDHQRDAYTELGGYMSVPFYGAQAPCMAPPYITPWGYYAPVFPIMHCQIIPFNPQFHHVRDTALPDQTQ